MSNETANLLAIIAIAVMLVAWALVAFFVEKGLITRAAGMQKVIMSAIFTVTICMGSFLVQVTA
jgi:hypothetical protein